MCEVHTPARIHIITVIYHQRIDEIASLPEFEKLQRRHPEVNLIVADNSTDENILEYNRVTASVKENLRYIECGGNIGLSRAYNRALATIPQKQPFWVMLADDDTHFSMEYLENGYRQAQREAKLAKQRAKGNCQREPLQMLCGIVETNSGWISPRTEYSKEMVFSSLLIKPKPGIYQDLYPINSGLFLDGEAIARVGGFDERLFLDQVDFLMMDRLRACGIRRIGVLPGQIRQSFSGELNAGRTKEKETAAYKKVSEPTGTSESQPKVKSQVKELYEPKDNKEKNDPDLEPQSADRRWEIFRRDFETYCRLTDKPWYYRSYILGRRKLMLKIQRVIARGR